MLGGRCPVVSAGWEGVGKCRARGSMSGLRERKWSMHARSAALSLHSDCRTAGSRQGKDGGACLLLLQVLLRQVLEVTLGEGDVRGDSHLRLVPRDRDHVTKVAGLARHLDAVLQKLLLRSDRAGSAVARRTGCCPSLAGLSGASVPCAGHGAAAHEGRSIHDAVIHRLRAVHGELQRLLALHNLLRLLNRLRAEGTARLMASKAREVAGGLAPP